MGYEEVNSIETKRKSESVDMTASSNKRCKDNPDSIESEAVQKDSPPCAVQSNMEVVPETSPYVLSQSAKADLASKAAEERKENNDNRGIGNVDLVET